MKTRNAQVVFLWNDNAILGGPSGPCESTTVASLSLNDSIHAYYCFDTRILNLKSPCSSSFNDDLIGFSGILLNSNSYTGLLERLKDPGTRVPVDQNDGRGILW